VTQTEDRLTDALAAVARGVREETLPPLPAADYAAERQWRKRWLAPAAAGATVVIIVVLLSAIHLFSGGPPRGQTSNTPGPPRFYATEESFHILIRRTATGALVSRVPSPLASGPTPGTKGHMWAASVAAVAGDRKFVAAYTGVPLHSTVEQTRLYTFYLTGAGRVTQLSMVRGGVIFGLDAGSVMSVSPDGSQVALAAYRPVRLGSPPSPPAIVVIDLRTGTSGAWGGGLARPGFALSIPSISWTSGDHSLVFLAQWCKNDFAGGICARGPHAAQVRTLDLVAGGGRLSAGRVRLGESARYPYIAHALLTPSGKAVTLVVLGGPYLGKVSPIPQDLRVIQVPLGGGGRPQLLYHGVMGPHAAVFLGSDATGRYLLLAWRLNGWLDHGVLRPLAPQGGYAFVVAW
jgi:hypothetical protein